MITMALIRCHRGACAATVNMAISAPNQSGCRGPSVTRSYDTAASSLASSTANGNRRRRTTGTDTAIATR
jgi:hypothetical protein